MGLRRRRPHPPRQALLLLLLRPVPPQLPRHRHRSTATAGTLRPGRPHPARRRDLRPIMAPALNGVHPLHHHHALRHGDFGACALAASCSPPDGQLPGRRRVLPAGPRRAQPASSAPSPHLRPGHQLPQARLAGQQPQPRHLLLQPPPRQLARRHPDPADQHLRPRLLRQRLHQGRLRHRAARHHPLRHHDQRNPLPVRARLRVRTRHNPRSATKSRCPTTSSATPPDVSIGYDYDAAGFDIGTPLTLQRRALPDERRIQASDGYTWAHGKNTTKAGLEFNRVFDFIDNLYNENGSYSEDTATPSSPTTSTPPAASAAPATAQPTTSSTRASAPGPAKSPPPTTPATSPTTGAPPPRLTLTAGVRYEYEYIPANPYANYRNRRARVRHGAHRHRHRRSPDRRPARRPQQLSSRA